MADTDRLWSLRELLAQVPELTEVEREVLLSETVVNRALPLITKFAEIQGNQLQAQKDTTGEAIKSLAETILKQRESPKSFDEAWRRLSTGQGSIDWLEQLVTDVSDNVILGPIMGTVLATIHLITGSVGVLSVSAERTKQIAQKTIRPFLLDLETLTRMFYRHPERSDYVVDQMAKMGISDGKITDYLSLQQHLPDLNLLRTALHRGFIEDGEFNDRLLEQQFRSEDIELIKKSIKVFPGVGDLVRFGVREVFDTEFAEKAGLFRDVPRDFIEETKKAGYDEKYSLMEWGAHWKPPSVLQAFDMFHRGEIDLDELKVLLRIQDIMPGYRDKLINIAYHPISRVDLRRIYADGMIEFDRLVQGYTDLGYSPETALLISEWVDARYGQESKERTRADIRKLYKLGQYNSEQAITALMDIGYPEDIATEDILRIDIEREEKERKARLKVWERGYIAFAFSEAEVKNLMSIEGIGLREQQSFILDWKVERDTKVKHLPLTVVKALFDNNLINPKGVFDRLLIQGYDQNDVQLLIKLWRGDSGQAIG